MAIHPIEDRYGSDGMRRIWDTKYKRELWIRFWASLAHCQYKQNKDRRFADLAAYLNIASSSIDIQDVIYHSAVQIEAESKHELDAFRQAVEKWVHYKSKGDWTIANLVHIGCTSSDVQDAVTIYQMASSINIIIAHIKGILSILRKRISSSSVSQPRIVMGYTHLQAAMPTTMTYIYLEWLASLDRLLRNLYLHHFWFKGASGPVGTGTLMTYVVKDTYKLDINLLHHFYSSLAYSNISLAPASTQTYTRMKDVELAGFLLPLVTFAHKVALDSRVLAAMDEIDVEFGKDQIGSSSMPHKKNPINAENVCGLCQMLIGHFFTISNMHAHQMLERTLDDSSIQRSLWPTIFLLLDEILIRLEIIINNSVRHEIDLKGIDLSTVELTATLMKGESPLSRNTLRKHMEMSGAFPNDKIDPREYANKLLFQTKKTIRRYLGEE